MLETSARLLRLLSLFQSRRYWTGTDLAERLEVTTRTLRRDVDKLRSLGYPIHSTSGLEGGYQLGAGADMPPLLLNDDEAVAVALGLRYATSGSITGMEEASLSALAKIEQLMPARLARQVAALRTVIVSPSAPEPVVDARTLSMLAAACRDHESVQFRYRDDAGALTNRSIEPHRLVHTRRWYLVAWDLGRKAWRTFRVDRIEGRLKLGPRFDPRELPSPDLASYVSQNAWVFARCRARIQLLIGAEEAARRIPPNVGVIEPIDEHRCFFDIGSPSYELMAMHLGWVGFDFEVSEPPELVAEVRRVASRYQRGTAKTD
jgi:predicted DNA-binding transcriptional regulator YafY